MNSKTQVLYEKYAGIHEIYKADTKNALRQKYGDTLQTEHNYAAWLLFTPEGNKHAKTVVGLSEAELATQKQNMCEQVRDSWGYFQHYYTEDFGIRDAMLKATGKRLV